MKHLSDNDITEELDVLGQSFRPSSTQKENLHRQIFQPNRYKKAFRIRIWLPNFVTLLFLFSVGIGTFVLFNSEYSIGTGKGELVTDVTASWDGVLLEQSSRTSRTNYAIMFIDNSLVINDRFFDYVYNPDMSEKDVFEKYKIKEVPLVAGKYTNYSIKKNNDTYIIKVTGKREFTYTLKKIAPRKFISKEGIEYSTRTYLE